MNEQYEKWLDEQLARTVNSGKVAFDAAKWKQKYSSEYQALVSRAGSRPNVQRFSWVRLIVRAAAVIAIAGLVIFLASRRSEKRVEPRVVSKSEQSPAMLMSRLSLMLAYNRGGMDAVDEQCKKAFELLGQKNTKVSINELLNENDGKKPGREKL